MKNNKIKVDGITFVEGTKRYKVYQLHKEGKTPEEISSLTETEIGRIRYYLYKFRKLSSIVSTQPVEEVPTEGEPTPTHNLTNNLIVTLQQDRETKELILFVKVSEEFENWIKNNREKKTTNNLWGKRETGEYYQMKIINNYLDDINTPIIYGGRINFAILRCVGVSKGLKFKVDGLITGTQLKKASRLFALTYKKFFRDNIEREELNYRIEVLEEL